MLSARPPGGKAQQPRFQSPLGTVVLMALSMLVVTVALLALGVAGAARAAELPRVQDGRLDLSSWSFERSGDLELKGDWHIYIDQLLEPADFAGPSPPTEAVHGTRRWYATNVSAHKRGQARSAKSSRP